jgi:NADPH:quinone reductase-like Zn-dependent oxidoreductase
MSKRGLLRTKVEKVYALRDAKAAVAHAMQEKRGGKVVFDLAL